MCSCSKEPPERRNAKARFQAPRSAGTPRLQERTLRSAGRRPELVDPAPLFAIHPARPLAVVTHGTSPAVVHLRVKLPELWRPARNIHLESSRRDPCGWRPPSQWPQGCLACLLAASRRTKCVKRVNLIENRFSFLWYLLDVRKFDHVDFLMVFYPRWLRVGLVKASNY